MAHLHPTRNAIVISSCASGLRCTWFKLFSFISSYSKCSARSACEVLAAISSSPVSSAVTAHTSAVRRRRGAFPRRRPWHSTARSRAGQPSGNECVRARPWMQKRVGKGSRGVACLTRNSTAQHASGASWVTSSAVAAAQARGRRVLRVLGAPRTCGDARSAKAPRLSAMPSPARRTLLCLSAL